MDSNALLLTETSINIRCVLVALVLILFLKWWLSSTTSKQYKLPPGPTRFPLIGNLPQALAAKEMNRAFIELGEKYGDIYMLQSWNFNVVVVCSLEGMKEGLLKKGDIFKGRPNWMIPLQKVFGNKGVFFNNGQVWKDLRRFTISTLRDLGMGKSKFEEKILFETNELAKVFESYEGKKFNGKIPLVEATFNIIYHIVFGERLDRTETDFKKLIDIINYFFQNSGFNQIEYYLPFLYYIPWSSPLKKVIKNDAVLKSHVYKKIREHRLSLDANNPKDFIDAYLLLAPAEENDSFTEANICRVITDLIATGSETSSASLIWAFVYMAKYKDVQCKCREEIKKVTDFSRMVRMSDQKDLPYVCATVLELQRVASVLPGTAPHVAEMDSTLCGYDIPKGTIVQFMLDVIHKSPKYWKDPHLFEPGRWLTNDKKIVKHEAYLPFAWGPRSCLGEPLAKMEMFLFFSNLLQRFNFDSADDCPVSLEGQALGITFLPLNTMIRALPI